MPSIPRNARGPEGGFLVSTIVVASALIFGSCGYSTGSLLPGDIRRLAIDVFENDTRYREIEFRLTRELAEEFNHRSAYRVSRRRHADALIEGRILRVERPTLVETDDDLVSEQAVIVTARITLTDLKQGRIVTEFTLSNRAEFVVERGENLQSAFDESLADLAEDIVNRLEGLTYREDLEKVRNGD